MLLNTFNTFYTFKYKPTKIHITKVIWHMKVAPQKRQFLKTFEEITLKLHKNPQKLHCALMS